MYFSSEMPLEDVLFFPSVPFETGALVVVGAGDVVVFRWEGGNVEYTLLLLLGADGGSALGIDTTGHGISTEESLGTDLLRCRIVSIT